MAVEANKRSTRIPGIANPLPGQRRAKLYYSTMIGLNLWQKPQQDRYGGGILRESQITRAKAFCPVAAANAPVVKGEFQHLSLCGNGSLSISHRSRIGAPAGYAGGVGHSKFVTPP